MGLLIEGKWHDQWYDTKSTDGKFIRQESAFRNWITKDGTCGPSGKGGFKAEVNRYHLYVSLACPWAHRTLIFRILKGLEDIIDVSIVHWLMAERGWTFEAGEGVIPDPLHRATYLYEIYTAADSSYSGRVTVPVLWDTRTETIVNNESSEIIRMFNSAFEEVGANSVDFYPSHLREEIDSLNARIYSSINNGVYKAGFATTQNAYEEAVYAVFECLDWLDERLATKQFLCGNEITEADWRLFTSLIRFDPVYVGHFKCNKKRIVDYSNLKRYLRDLFSVPGVADTCDFSHIKRHYYESHKTINPTGVVPLGPCELF